MCFFCKSELSPKTLVVSCHLAQKLSFPNTRTQQTDYLLYLDQKLVENYIVTTTGG